MSKIQDALQRIKSSAPTVESKLVADDVSATQSFARLTAETDETGIHIRPDDGGLILVDHDALRSAGYLAPLEQQRHLADQYRIIKRPILQNASDKAAYPSADSNLVMVTSALAGDGKTFNCINLALSIAREKDTSVLLVDADVAKPHISELFGIGEQPGLIELLKDDSKQVSSSIVRSDVPGLSLLPAGQPDEHATELLASKRMSQIVSELSVSAPNRIVIFDSPPLLLTSESRVLAGAMGQISVVVRAGRTPKQSVQESLESLDSTKAINLILNESASGIGADGYGYYRYGYGQG